MVALSIIMRSASAAVTVYMFFCSIRIFLTWAPGIDTGRAGYILRRITDPYLGFFSRFPILRSGRFDFSPIAALAALAVVNNILSTVAFAGRLTFGLVLGMALSAAWSALAFFLSFLAVCAFVRVVAYMARWNSLHPVWMVVDSILNPVLYRLNHLFYRGRIVNYMQGLVTGLAVLVFFRLAGGALVSALVRLLGRLPV
jgi:YggT family protein